MTASASPSGAPRRRFALSRRLARLGSDGGYWPADVEWPALRLLLGAALAPLLLAALLALVYSAVFLATDGAPTARPFSLWSEFRRVFDDGVDGFYRAMLIWFVPAFAILYVTGLRSKRAYLIAALIAAALEFGVESLNATHPRPVTWIGASVLYALLFQAIRAIAGIRSS